ncbi:MAG TPA: zinc-ribbon domain-containing protein [Flavobacteriaceae bacterium]|nr:zinc-ribbon domain-containing protein [Flavobacteriaceae bacterium]
MECKNCQKQLAPSDKFCGNCGAKKISHRLTLKHIIS